LNRFLDEILNGFLQMSFKPPLSNCSKKATPYNPTSVIAGLTRNLPAQEMPLPATA
jgi:hypothetical protein